VIAQTSIAIADEDRQFAAREAEEIKRLLKKTAENIIIIGQKLSAVKARLKHGEWGAWLRDECDPGERTAQNFMAVGERFKNENFADLNIAPSALYMLASPSTPDDIRQSILEQARSGARITLAAVQQAIGPGDSEEVTPQGNRDAFWLLNNAPDFLRFEEDWHTSMFMRAFIDGKVKLADLEAAKSEAFTIKDLSAELVIAAKYGEAEIYRACYNDIREMLLKRERLWPRQVASFNECFLPDGPTPDTLEEIRQFSTLQIREMFS